jgi:hypothetical protein
MLTIPPPERLRLSANCWILQNATTAVAEEAFLKDYTFRLSVRSVKNYFGCVAATRSIMDCWKTPILNFKTSDKTIDMFIRERFRNLNRFHGGYRTAAG